MLGMMSIFSQFINGILLLNSFNNDSTSQIQLAQTEELPPFSLFNDTKAIN